MKAIMNTEGPWHSRKPLAACFGASASLMLIILSLLLFPALVSASAADPCLECHEKKTPGIVNYWKESAHGQKRVGCADCHGTDVDANHARKTIVDASKCGLCHKKPFEDHSLSRHGSGLKTGRGCTRNMEKSDDQQKSCTFCHAQGSPRPLVEAECAMFLAQRPEMQRQGCDSCHRVEVRCDTCHTKHGTDLSLAKRPETCGTCHMGPDHAQYEMWESSSHGVIYRKNGERAAPSCATCHMKGGSHNVSKGIVTGLPAESSGLRTKERDLMVRICSECHTESLARRSLGDADAIERQSRALVDEAQEIIKELNRDNLLLPTPSLRPPHPLFGKDFIIGPHMLYENLSSIESLFFRMKQFHYMNTYKGAFHQNPDYTHWYGNAPLKLALSEIKSEALMLREMAVMKKRLENLSASQGLGEDEAGEIRKRLRELNDRRLKGEISDKDYGEMKDRILKEKGL